MLNNKLIAVVIAAYNEQSQIENVIKTIPEFVDRIVIVNDASLDKTKEKVENIMLSETNMKIDIQSDARDTEAKRTPYNKAEIVLTSLKKKEISEYVNSEVSPKSKLGHRIVLINHIKNSGKGAVIATGYKWCRDNMIDCTAVMDGDGQMDPEELELICNPIIYDNIDYVKGNRLKHRSAFFVIPKIRYFGNSILSLLTKIASGYWRVSDTQTGYTAISLAALNSIRIYDIYKSYGYPNDLLVKLNIAFCTLKEIEIKPVYNVGEQSKMKIGKVIPSISWLLFSLFIKRLYIKYLFRDFHPLFLLYHLSFFLLIFNIPFFYEAIVSLIPGKIISLQSLIIFTFLSISGLQSLFFAMWMDMMDNERLQF